MFRVGRPYSFTSIGIWTLANLAANRAYYRCEVGPRGTRRIKVPLPEEVKTLTQNLNGISESFFAHVKSATAAFTEDMRSLDLTPFVVTRGYRDWLMDNRESIRGEIYRTQSAVAQKGIDLEQAYVEQALAFVDELIAGMTKTSDLLLRSLLETISKNEQREELRSKIVELLDDVRVDQRTWRVSYHGQRVTIRNNNAK